MAKLIPFAASLSRRRFMAALATALPASSWALYDPKPDSLLAWAPGSWVGTLTYRDWSNPDKLVTLPCKLAIAMTTPAELALFYEFDDGPGKVVYSYERMAFDFKASRLTWASGIKEPSTSQYALKSATATESGTEILFEQAAENQINKYALVAGKNTFTLSKTEVAASGKETFRNKYEFRRSGI